MGSRGLFFRAHEREEEDIADRMGSGEEHDKAVDADADAAGGGHPLADRFDKLFIERMGFFIARLSFMRPVRRAAGAAAQDR